MQVYLGIDWSEQKHDALFMDEDGRPLVQLTVPHTPDGFLRLDVARQRLGLATADCLVGLETAHTLLIDFLWAKGYTLVYVIPPSVVKSIRGRYGQSGARSDESDALLLADLLRTDRARLHPWHPDSLLTRQLRAKVSLILHLTGHIVSLSNRLRSVLLRYYPAALQVFSRLRSPITLAFVLTYPTPEAAAALTFDEFVTFARQHRYTHPRRLPACFARLQQPQPEAGQEVVKTYQDEAAQLATLLLDMVQTKKRVLCQLQHLFSQHPDQAIFASLPGAGRLLAPGLLAKFGDDRQRFTTPGSVQALAGTCPVTQHSGKRRVVKFRRACDHEFRHIAQQLAIASTTKSLWAQGYWQLVRPRCDSDNHAYRCLANRWLAIAWKLWQTRQPYDEAYHWQRRMARTQPRR